MWGGDGVRVVVVFVGWWGRYLWGGWSWYLWGGDGVGVVVMFMGWWG